MCVMLPMCSVCVIIVGFASFAAMAFFVSRHWCCDLRTVYRLLWIRYCQCGTGTTIL